MESMGFAYAFHHGREFVLELELLKLNPLLTFCLETSVAAYLLVS